MNSLKPLNMSDELAENPAEIERMGRLFLQAILEYWSDTTTAHVHPGQRTDTLSVTEPPDLPPQGTSLESLLAEFSARILPGVTRVASPRYLGMMNPCPALVAVFCESLAAALNQNCSLWHQSPAAVELEKCVIHWLCRLVGLPDDTAFGLLVSGGSIANITAIKLARTRALGLAARDDGLWSQPPLTIYASNQAHYSFEKAVDFLGMGTRSLRYAPVDDSFRVRPEQLRRLIEQDRDRGLTPACLIGIAGSTNTGSVDPLDELADLAAEFGLWYHVDAAYGGAATMLPETTPLFRGIDRADSITLDPHKWFSIPYEGAALLVRDRSTLNWSFGNRPHYYLEQGTRETERINFFEYGLQGSRSFKALKIWFTFRFFGLDYYRHLLRRNLAFANRLHQWLAGSDDFEPLHHPDLGILCFRARPGRKTGNDTLTAGELNDLNRRLHLRLEQEGRFWISLTRLNPDVVALRVNFENYRTREADLEELFAHLTHLYRQEV